MPQTYDRQSYESWDDYVLRKLKEERNYLKKIRLNKSWINKEEASHT